MEGVDGVREDDMPMGGREGQCWVREGGGEGETPNPCFLLPCAGGHLILSLDYSSTMALVQLEVLNQLEKATGKRIVDMIEWIVVAFS